MSSTRTTLNKEYAAIYHESSDVEVIEDSEPEREEKREQARLEKRRLQGTAPTSNTLVSREKSMLPPATPILPTQSMSESSSSVVSNSPPENTSQNLASLPDSPVILSAPARQVAPPPWLVSKDASDPKPITESLPDKPGRTKPSSQPSPVKQLDINSFAFHKRPSGARSSSYSTSKSASSSKLTDPETAGPSKPKPMLSAKPSVSPKAFCLSATNGPSGPDATFSPEQITLLTSCVVCSNSWTVRKLAKSKWSHITACARKNGCGNEALYMKLIAAIVEASDQKARDATKAKQKEKEKETTGPPSLLAHTVQERAPAKRRGRRKEPGPSSLRPVEEAQRVILQRSIALLGDDVPQQDENQPRSVAATQQEASDDEHCHIPATQAFAPSKIGGHSKFFGSTTSILNTDSASGLLYADEPRSLFANYDAVSQVASPRSAAVEDRNLRASPLSSPLDSPISLVNSSIISIDSSNHNSSSSEVEVLGDRTRSPTDSVSSNSVLVLDSSARGSLSSVLDDQLSDPRDEWNSQEGVYMWEDYAGRPMSPTDRLVDGLLGLSVQDPQGTGINVEPHGRSPLRTQPIRNPTASRSLSQPSSPDRPLALNSLSKSRSPHSSSPDQPLATTRSKTKPKAKRPISPPPPKKQTKKKPIVYAPEDVQNEGDATSSKDIDEKLLAMIINDKALYLRILRFEPIKFEDIFDAAVANGIPKHGLQNRLKTFLDSQCVNFYSGDNIGRRKRHP